MTDSLRPVGPSELSQMKASSMDCTWLPSSSRQAKKALHLSQRASVQPGSIIDVFLISFNVRHAIPLAARIITVAVQVADVAIGRMAALSRDGHKLRLRVHLVHGAFAQRPCAEIRGSLLLRQNAQHANTSWQVDHWYSCSAVGARWWGGVGVWVPER